MCLLIRSQNQGKLPVIDFKELDRRYPDEEYKTLSETLESKFQYPNLCQVGYAIKIYLNRDWLVMKSQYKDKVYESISEWMYRHSYEDFKMLYEIPFYEIPLFINGVSVGAIIAAWRLYVGH